MVIKKVVLLLIITFWYNGNVLSQVNKFKFINALNGENIDSIKVMIESEECEGDNALFLKYDNKRQYYYTDRKRKIDKH